MKKLAIIISILLLFATAIYSFAAVSAEELSVITNEETADENTVINNTAWERKIDPILLEEFEYAPDDYIFCIGLALHNDWTGLDELLEETPYLPGESYLQWYDRVSNIIYEQQLNQFVEQCSAVIDFEIEKYDNTEYELWVNTDEEGIRAFASLSKVYAIVLDYDYVSPFEKPDAPEMERPNPDDIPAPQIGDVNGDGVVNSLDAALVLKFDADLIEYVPVSEPLEIPDEETVDCIRNDYWTNHLGNTEGGTSVWETTIDDVRISKYYGNVNGCEIVFMEDNYPEIPAYQTVWVGSHGFVYGVLKEAFAYKDGQFYTFGEAYEGGYLRASDIYTLGTRMPLQWDEGSYDAVKMGDCNFDGEINSLDAAWILRYDAGLIQQ